jgi:cell division protein ZapA (FtsZ GTPase activity inhibitor)
MVLADQGILNPLPSDRLQLLEPIAEHEFGNEYASLLEIGSKVEAHLQTQARTKVDALAGEGTTALATYLPDSGPYDNPATDTIPVATIPSTPSCTIRGQTIFEIRKMRADAKQIGMSIMYEIQTMEKRKTYIEQMTAYLNDRIRELNKVKRDLAAEQKWIQVSNSRISELAQKEKLIKLQDVMSCIKSESERLAGEKGSKTAALTAMGKEAANLENNIKTIRTSMDKATADAAAQAAGQPMGEGASG